MKVGDRVRTIAILYNVDGRVAIGSIYMIDSAGKDAVHLVGLGWVHKANVETVKKCMFK